MMKNQNDPSWVRTVISQMETFAKNHSTLYSKRKRELWAYFEIGTLLTLIDHYEEKGCHISAENLEKGEYRYKTSPEGNPQNFSYVKLFNENESFEIRQQIRIQSHIDNDITFTPDILVVNSNPKISMAKIPEYHRAKRPIIFIPSSQVIAAHECKSLLPFPELLISFIGTLVVAHSWYENGAYSELLKDDGMHLAPTLFIGGSSRPLHFKIIDALKRKFPINIITGLHSGTIKFGKHHCKYIRNPFVAYFDS